MATDEQYETMRDADAFGEDMLTGAADAILFEGARQLLLGGMLAGDAQLVLARSYVPPRLPRVVGF